MSGVGTISSYPEYAQQPQAIADLYKRGVEGNFNLSDILYYIYIYCSTLVLHLTPVLIPELILSDSTSHQKVYLAITNAGKFYRMMRLRIR